MGCATVHAVPTLDSLGTQYLKNLITHLVRTTLSPIHDRKRTIPWHKSDAEAEHRTLTASLSRSRISKAVLLITLARKVGTNNYHLAFH